MPPIRIPYCPLLRSPLLIAPTLVVILLGAGYVILVRQERHQLAIGMAQPSAAVDPDLWAEYALATPDGTIVAQGAVIPVGTSLRAVRVDNTQPPSDDAQFSITVLGTFQGRHPATIQAPSSAVGRGTGTQWNCATLPLGAIVRFDQPGEVRATVLRRHIYSGIPKPLVFSVVERPSTSPSEAPAQP